MTQRQVAEESGVSVSYISKVEGERLHFGDYPSEKFLTKLAQILDADLDELLLLTDRVPESIRKRVREHPSEFRRLAELTDAELYRVVSTLDPKSAPHM